MSALADIRVVRWVSKVIPVSPKYDLDGACFVQLHTGVEKKTDGSPLPEHRPLRRNVSGGAGEDLIVAANDVSQTTEGATSSLADDFQSVLAPLLGAFSGNTGGGKGTWHATPNLLILVSLAVSDVVFALDSIPAILSVTTDPFIVITSNCWAVMGLRSLFFVLSALQNMFKYLQHGVAVILAFVGLKMILGYFGLHISTSFMLTFMVSVLSVSMYASIKAAK